MGTNLTVAGTLLADHFSSIESCARSDPASSLLQVNRFLASRARTFLNRAGGRAFADETSIEHADLLWLSVSEPIDTLACIKATEAASLANPLEHPSIAFVAIDDRLALVAVPSGTAHFSTRPFPHTGLPRLSLRELTLELDIGRFCLDVQLGPGAGKELFFQITAERWLLLSAVILGVAQAAFNYVLDYARKRMAFGKAIAHHQAVALKLADTLIAIESSRLLCQEVCVSGDRGAEIFYQVRGIWRYINETVKMAPDIIQVMGGHGYLQDHPVQQWFCDLQLLSLLGEFSDSFAGFLHGN